MATLLHSRAGSLASVDEEFLELVCGDEQLLRDEFDAIIAAGWPTPRPPTTPRAMPWPPVPQRTHPAVPGPVCRGGCTGRPVRGQGRERSPPQLM